MTADMNADMNIAAVQMVSTPDVAQNMEQAGQLIRQAAGQGARLVLLPEYWPILGRHETDKLAVAESAGQGPVQQWMADIASELGIWLIGGTVPLVSDEAGKVLNTCLAFDPRGAVQARYDKIHLFDFTRGEESYNESRTITAGSQVVSLEAPCGRVGLSVCYDLRFPELYRAMGECALLVVPSAFTYTTGRAHWEILLRARAIENQCYVLAAAQGGIHPNGRRTWGHSMLIDPWGEIVAVLPEGPGIAAGALKQEALQRVRGSLPALSHRRL
jgi:predicted amidohydrolase